MSKGLRALKEYRAQQQGVNVYADELLDIAEKELKRLEDIEELCEKVVNQPIYEKYADTHEIHKEDYTECRALYSFEYNRIELYLRDFVNYFELDQYGKTWAFTKEELE